MAAWRPLVEQGYYLSPRPISWGRLYAQYFGESAAARSTVEVVRLPKDVLIEVEAIAHR